MYYAAMRKFDVANGIGIRTTLFVSGCTLNCRECFNGEYQDFRYGQQWNEASKTLFLQYIDNENVRGATILGGEPLDQILDNDLLDLVQAIKSTGKDLWLYSGYTYEEIIQNPKKRQILAYCDVLVDGRYEANRRNLMLKFRGSSNQRVIDVQKSMATDGVVELILE